MRLSELAGKRIINLYDGEVLGSAGDSDLLIEADSGRIVQLWIPQGKNAPFGSKNGLAIAWSAVRKIGPELIVVEVEYP